MSNNRDINSSSLVLGEIFSFGIHAVGLILIISGFLLAQFSNAVARKLSLNKNENRGNG